MTFLSDSDKQQISEAIRQAESKTSGELVTVLARAADDYRYIPLLWASLIALIIPGIIWYTVPYMDFISIYQIQIACFIGLVLLFSWSPVKMRLIPGSVKHRRAGTLAHEQFYANGLHLTENHTGVMLFVSIAEHHVEILADQGINDKVEQDAWSHIVADFVGHIESGDVREGFVSTIQACGHLLETHFPKHPDNPDELPNHLIEL